MRFSSFSPNLIFNYLTVVLAFTIPLSIGAYTTLSALLVVIWIWEGNWKYKWDMIREQKVFFWLGIFFFYYLLTLIWSDNLAIGLNYLRKYYFFLLIPMFYTSLQPAFFSRIIKAFLAAMIISEVLSYLIYFESIPFKYKPSWTPANPSPFMSRGVYSFFLAFTVFLMLINLFNKRHSLLNTAVYVFFIITMMANLFINAGRTGQFSLGIALIVFLLTYFQFKIIKSLAITITSSLIIFLLAFQFSPNFHSRSIETFHSITHLIDYNAPLNDSTGFRVMMWETAVEILKSNPIFGVGLGDDRIAYQSTLINHFPQYYPQIIGFSDFHNTYLQIAVNGGIIALILWCAILFSMFLSLNTEPAYHGIGTVMLTLLILYMMIGYLPAAYITILFVLIMGIALKRPSEAFRNTVVQ